MSAPVQTLPHVTVRPGAGLRQRSFWGTIVAALAIHRQRKRLAELDSHALSDIGITPAAARMEARRPVWDAPDHWLR